MALLTISIDNGKTSLSVYLRNLNPLATSIGSCSEKVLSRKGNKLRGFAFAICYQKCDTWQLDKRSPS
jgi:hypothetical protein